MPFGKKRSKQEQEELKEKIILLVTQGYPDRKIYKHLKIPERTFYNYMKAISENLRKKHLSKTNMIIFGYVTRSQDRIKELHKTFRETGNEKCLRDAQHIENSLAQFYLDVGILEKSPEKIKQEVTYVTYKKPEWLKDKDSEDSKRSHD